MRLGEWKWMKEMTDKEHVGGAEESCFWCGLCARKVRRAFDVICGVQAERREKRDGCNVR